MGKTSRKKKAAAQAAPSPETKQTPQQLPAEPLERLDFIFAAISALIAFAVYLKTLCPTIYTSGAGENVTAVATLGVPHPPGFPLFCLLGKLFTVVLPVGSIAFRVNLFSALCGSMAVAVLFVAMRMKQSKKARYACVAAALMFAFSQTFWSQAIIAEVYTLNALILSLILLFLLRWEQGKSILPVALCAGLGLAVHPLQALFFPGWTLFIWKSPARKTIRKEQFLPVLILFGAGIALHLYPFIRSKANPPLDWGNPENFKNWFAYLTASQYRERMFSLKPAEVMQNLWEAAKLFTEQWTPPLLLLPAVGGWILFRRNRVLLVATALSAFITIVYAINYNIPWEIDVYYIPAILMFCFWSCWTLTLLAEKFHFLQFAVAAIAIFPLVFNFKHNDLSRHKIAEAYGLDILNTCPHNSSLMIPQTDASFALLYLMEVQHIRNDVTVWVGSPAELKKLADGVNPDVRPLKLTQLLDHGPFFLSERLNTETLPGYQQVPYGILFQVLRKGISTRAAKIDFANYRLNSFVSPLPDFYLDNRSRTILSYYMISQGDAAMASAKKEEAANSYRLARELAPDFSEVGNQLAMRLEDLGDPKSAIDQLRKNLAAFEDAPSYNRLGRLLAQSGQTDEAMSNFLRAIEIDPNLAIAHSNLGALYGMKGDLTRAEQELLLAVKLDPEGALARNNLARLYTLTGRKDQARIELQKSLEIDPDQPEVRKLLSEL